MTIKLFCWISIIQKICIEIKAILRAEVGQSEHNYRLSKIATKTVEITVYVQNVLTIFYSPHYWRDDSSSRVPQVCAEYHHCLPLPASTAYLYIQTQPSITIHTNYCRQL